MSFSDIGVDFLALETHSLYLITCHCGFIQDNRFILLLTIIQTSLLFYLFPYLYIYIYLPKFVIIFFLV